MTDTEKFAFIKEHLYVAAVSDILDSLDRRKQVMHHRLRPLLPDIQNCGFVGRARTAQWIESPHIDEQDPYGLEIDLIDSLQPGDVVVADRAFCSYAHLALLRQRGVHAVFRAHQRQIIDFSPHRPYAKPGTKPKDVAGKPRSRWVRSLGEKDQVVEYFKPKECPDWMDAQEYASLPDSLLVREVCLEITDRDGHRQELTLVTTLLDARRIPRVRWPTCTS